MHLIHITLQAPWLSEQVPSGSTGKRGAVSEGKGGGGRREERWTLPLLYPLFAF